MALIRLLHWTLYSDITQSMFVYWLLAAFGGATGYQLAARLVLGAGFRLTVSQKL